MFLLIPPLKRVCRERVVYPGSWKKGEVVQCPQADTPRHALSRKGPTARTANRPKEEAQGGRGIALLEDGARGRDDEETSWNSENAKIPPLRMVGRWGSSAEE